MNLENSASPHLQDFKIQKDKLKEHVIAIAGIRPIRNFWNLRSLNQAADYIENELKHFTPNVERQSYEIKGKVYHNIIAPCGAAGRRMVVGAHYDVFDKTPGADDNASAVAALLELARAFFEQKPRDDLRIDFVAYTLEEPPFFSTPQMGSAIHAKLLKSQGVNLEAMICLEMLGYFSDRPHSQDYPLPEMRKTYPDQGNFIAIVANRNSEAIGEKLYRAMRKTRLIPVEKITAPASVTGVDFSDHRNYWEAGYPAVMITDTAFYRNPNYHQISDLPTTLNYQKMTAGVEALYRTLSNW